MLIAQITDMHITAEGEPSLKDSDTAGNLARVVAAINRFSPRPDMVIATGDLVNDASPASCVHLKALLTPLAVPVYLVPGNHDDRDALRTVFPDHDYLPSSGRLNYVIDRYPVRVIALDTVIPGAPGGELDDGSLAWLDERLSEATDQPTVIAMHHPPFATGIHIMDGMNCENGDRMEAIVARHPQILRVMCGHVHRAIQIDWGGTAAMISGATSMQLNLELDPDSNLGWTKEPPLFTLHNWRPGGDAPGHMVSFVCPVGDFEKLAI